MSYPSEASGTQNTCKQSIAGISYTHHSPMYADLLPVAALWCRQGWAKAAETVVIEPDRQPWCLALYRKFAGPLDSTWSRVHVVTLYGQSCSLVWGGLEPHRPSLQCVQVGAVITRCEWATAHSLWALFVGLHPHPDSTFRTRSLHSGSPPCHSHKLPVFSIAVCHEGSVQIFHPNDTGTGLWRDVTVVLTE